MWHLIVMVMKRHSSTAHTNPSLFTLKPLRESPGLLCLFLYFLSPFLFSFFLTLSIFFSGNHLITKILLELKSFPLMHDVVLQWNEEWLVLFTIRASVELEITDFVIVAKIVKVIFIYFHLKKSSPFFLPFTFYLYLGRLTI